MKELKIDADFKNLIPPLTDEEYKQLEENLIRDGCRDSLVVWNGTIIDGHNRYEICNKHNIEFETKEVEFEAREDVIEWIIRNQFGRRNLPSYERAKLALKLKPIIQAKAKENKQNAIQKARKENPNNVNEQFDQKIGKTVEVNTNKELGKIAGISDETIRRVEIIENEGSEEVQAQARKGEISINKAFNLTRKPETAKTNEEIEMRVCSVCGKEKPVTEFYNNLKECRSCCSQRRVNKLTVKEARELNKLCPEEMIEAIIEDMKNPTSKKLEAGLDENHCNPIITEFEGLLNDFIRNIRKFTFMPQVKESETLKTLTDEAVEILKKIMN